MFLRGLQASRAGEERAIDREKNPAAVELGRKGGLARAGSLSPERRREISLRGVEAKRQKERDRPEVHSVVKSMMIAILAHGKEHALFFERGQARFVAADDPMAARWQAMTPECFVGTYGAQATLTEILTDVLSI